MTLIKYWLLVLPGFFMITCQENNTVENEVDEEKTEGLNDLQGTWNLIEINISTGGPSDFVPISSDKYIQINADSSFISNGTYCQMNHQATGEDIRGFLNDAGEIIQDDCASQNFPVRYRLENKELIIAYPCIEPCFEKYIKK